MTESVISQAIAQYGTKKRDRYVEYAKECLDKSFPGVEWTLLDFSTVDVNGWPTVESVEVFDPQSPHICFRVTPSTNTWNPRDVSVRLWSDGAPISEWIMLMRSDEFAKEIAEIPEFKQVYRESVGFGVGRAS